MERIKGANGELMKYSMQPMDGEGHLTLYRYDQLAIGGADNAHLEFWQEIEELRKQRADAQATIADLQGQLAECYRLSGADPDGDEDWRLAAHAVIEVKRLREESDKELDALQQRVAELEANRDKPIEQVDPRYWDANELRANNRLKAAHITELCEQLTTLQADHATLLGLVRALPVAERKVKVSKDGIFRSHLSVRAVGVGDEMTLSGTPELIKQIAAILRYRARLPAQSVHEGAKRVGIDDGVGGGENDGGWLWPRAIWRGVRQSKGRRRSVIVAGLINPGGLLVRTAGRGRDGVRDSRDSHDGAATQCADLF